LTHFSTPVYSWVAIIYISTKQKAKESIAYGEDIPRLNGKRINTRQDDAREQVCVCLLVYLFLYRNNRHVSGVNAKLFRFSA